MLVSSSSGGAGYLVPSSMRKMPAMTAPNWQLFLAYRVPRSSETILGPGDLIGKEFQFKHLDATKFTTQHDLYW